MKPSDKIVALGLAAWLFLFFSGCGRGTSERSEPGPAREKLTGFEYQRTGPDFNLLLKGEAATLDAGQGGTVTRPAGRIETAQGRIIGMETAPDGEAQLSFAPGSGEIESVTLVRGVKVTVKNRDTGEIELRAECDRMNYAYAGQELVLTGNPVVFYGANEFRGSTIRYFVREGRILIEGGASGLIYHDAR